MNNVFITEIQIDNVRHLKNINIPLSKEKMKHLIITGKNGSGKTSLLEAMSCFIVAASESDSLVRYIDTLESAKFLLDMAIQSNQSKNALLERETSVKHINQLLHQTMAGVNIHFSIPLDNMHAEFVENPFIISFFKADRVFQAIIPNQIEKVELQSSYKLSDSPKQLFVKYLLDLKMTEALARSSGKTEKADQIQNWFAKLERLLKNLFDDDSLTLEFDEDTFRFYIHESGREPFDFNSMSSGYAAVLDIVADIMIRMEKQSNKTFDYSMPGIVLIDEIETHLHLELQKKILNFLVTLFPNVQFIISTHSPFVLNSLDNVVIYDLEKHILVENGLANVPYEGVVDGYFEVDRLSQELRQKFEQYKKLATKELLTNADYAQLAELEMYLDEVPDYLAIDFASEYSRLKLELNN